MKYNYKTQGTCAREINFEIEDGKIQNVEFIGGCNGNLKAISLLCKGKDAKEIADTLRGNICGFKNTSCADQFAKALDKAMAQ